MKKTRRFTSLTLAALLITGGLPYHAFASENLSARDLEKVNKVTKAIAEFETAQVKIASSLNTRSSKTVSVIVQLASDPAIVSKHQGRRTLSAQALEAKVEKEQASFLREAKSKTDKLRVGRQFTQVFNGIELSLPANQIPDLAKLPNVKAIYENKQFSIPEVEVEKSGDTKYDTAPLKQIGVLDMWKLGLNGKGLKVGVIDTGVDYLHPDLKDAYKGGYDSYDNDKDPYEEAPIAPEDDREGGGYQGSSHGTHVSGTIVGRAKNTQSDVNVKGIAYAADLYVYRVLGRYGGSTAQVIDGIEKAVKDGMDVINLSLGSDYEKNADSPDSIAVNNAMLAGVITVVASGNAAQNEPGRHYYTAGSPAGAKLPITVGAVTSPSTLYDGSASSSFGKDYRFHVMAWQIKKENFAQLIGTNPLPVVYANLGSETDFQKVDVKGKVALISRGVLTFDAKIKNAVNAGAKAIVIFNGNDLDGDGVADLDLDQRTDYIGTILGDQMEAVPTFDMRGDEGRALAKEILADPDKAKTLTFTFSADYPKTEDQGDKMAGFSSRGPVLGDDYSIKPDVSAPGVSILSSIPAWKKLIPKAKYDLAYSRFNGTSMATPHVAGLALLLKQAHPEWTPFDVKAALSNTAKRISDEEGTPYDVYSQGAGRVDGYAAAKTPAVLETVENITILNQDLEPQTITYNGNSISFGLLKAGSDPVTRKLQLKNTSKEDVHYTAKVVMHKAVTTDPYDPQETPDVNDIDVSLSKTTINADGRDTTEFTLQLAPEADAEEGVYEGEVLLKSKDGNPDLHLPFVVHVGDQREDTHFGFDDLKLSDTNITPDGDGKEDSFTLEALLQAEDVNVIELQAWTYDDTYIGTMATMFDDYRMFAPGPITFSNLDGTYYDGSTVAKKLDPGKYKLRLVGYTVDPTLPKGEQIVNTYEAWKAFAISEGDGESASAAAAKAVKKAEDAFKAKIVNTSELDKAVLELPEDTDDVTYRVTRSSNDKYIDDNGVLKALPDDKTTVTLYVTIASAADPSVKATARVRVTLEP
ncbi:S8 family serine peptidase [Brevibacillus sp. SYP-B805]|uniref:S8 family serine peptidase n=1 Tax=Brevibacillus sp. SYP-B805 TaxID=1578199 RepID=UPI0013EB3977|nr:S8 family serine peptidase [Brevibacillus sp. SYP-B805]NGQ95915.1 S8 family serine peptidase [Brevibacillus sp. SYP-B805]